MSDTLADWPRFECETHADGARERTEVLWLNPLAYEQLRHKPTPLFDLSAPSLARSDP